MAKTLTCYTRNSEHFGLMTRTNGHRDMDMALERQQQCCQVLFMVVGIHCRLRNENIFEL